MHVGKVVGAQVAPTERKGVPLRLVASVLRPTLIALTGRRWNGGEHIPGQGHGVVVAPNHISDFDPLTCAHFLWDHGRIPRFLGKESLFRIPVLGRLITACGQIPVHRGTREAGTALAAATSAVEAGQCVIIYPEGTQTKDPRMWPMTGRSGAARVALQTGCPVVPLAQWGQHEVMHPITKKIRLFPRRTVHVRAGAPVDLDDLRGVPLSPAVLTEATDRIMDALTDEVAILRGETPPPTRFELNRDEG